MLQFHPAWWPLDEFISICEKTPKCLSCTGVAKLNAVCTCGVTSSDNRGIILSLTSWLCSFSWRPGCCSFSLLPGHTSVSCLGHICYNRQDFSAELLHHQLPCDTICMDAGVAFNLSHIQDFAKLFVQPN